MPYSMVKNIFRFVFFLSLWQIDTLNLTNKHIECRRHTLTCCREMLPQRFQNSVKREPHHSMFRSCEAGTRHLVVHSFL